MLFFGVDEAGRGAVIGPMVIAGVVISEENLPELNKIGVKDSKQLSRKQREDIFSRLENILEDFIVFEISAEKIDEKMKKSNLNHIEYEKIVEMLNALKPDRAIIDATEVNTTKIENILYSNMDNKLANNIELVVENYADSNYKVVGAASILAKVRRDNAIKELGKRLDKDIGIGYPSDKKTIKFLEEIVSENGNDLPGFVRKSWITTKRIIDKNNQGNLPDFCD